MPAFLIKKLNTFAANIAIPQLTLFFLFVIFLLKPALGAAVFLILLFSLKPEFGIYSLSFFLPAINWYVNFGFLNINAPGFHWEFSLPIVDALGIALFISYLIRIIFIKPEKIKRPVFFCFVLFLAVNLISAFFAFNFWESIIYSLRWILFFYAIFIILPANVIRSEKILRYALISFILSALIISLMGIASVFQQDLYNEFIRFKPVSIAGIYPIGDNQKQISEILASATMLALALLYWQPKPAGRRIIIGLFVLFNIILVGSFSRAAWLALSAQAVFLSVYFRKIILKNLSAGLVLAALAGMFLLPAGYYMFKLQASEIGYGSNKHRQLLTDVAWQGFALNPIIGAGAGMYKNLEEKSRRYQATYAPLMESHGLWQKIIAETGAAGLAAFVIFLAGIILHIGKKIKAMAAAERRQMAFFIMAAASIFMFEWFDTNFYKGKLWFIVGLMIAAADIFSRPKTKYENSSNQ
ncbi:hypothetical protein COT99_03275 [Candidatus Falkowbacteria bacterium CG10_big_fil_rev_8_21_14_0_10_43_10]|uniref:O-antigen ligase-related domain-containing protein n=1 Tax=Candidatus Falkowbacteria bacterium CG10_big_fil_rev_8_21_14_0_10_43_10 TaxID=1974567 RepID=A0A2H0V3H4_9BACT|nr:MAG: hypothetical protein COT99_03275 [Candidatus Falkowbacteria bacterium CG10_big_fil_rev_8_21_14_0_10_43_10]